jgi:hypothetical protein
MKAAVLAIVDIFVIASLGVSYAIQKFESLVLTLTRYFV